MRSLMTLLLTLFALGGCASTHKYVPTLYGSDPSSFGALNEASVARVIAFNNASEQDDQVLLGSKGFNEYYGSLQELTQTIVINAERELVKRQVTIDPAAPLGLDVRVTRVSTEATVLNVAVAMEVEVVAGNGLTRRLRISNKTPGSVPRALNGAAALAVVQILSDPGLLAYLSGN